MSRPQPVQDQREVGAHLPRTGVRRPLTAMVARVEFSDVIKKRRMVRSFTTEPLPEGTADRGLIVLGDEKSLVRTRWRI